MNGLRLLALLGILAATPARSAETAAFLKIGVGARPIAMGSAFTAVADDLSAIYWNPAGLASLQNRELGAMHAEMFGDLRYDFVGFAVPTNIGTLGVSANLLTQGSLDGRDAAGKPTGSFAASDRAVGVAYAGKLPGALRLGGNFKWLESSIGGASARGYALDFGGLYNLDRRIGIPLSLGFTLQNLGPGMKFLDETNPLPLTLAAGLGYRLPLGLTLALDYKYRPHAKASEFGFGTEYALLPALNLRMGYASGAAAALQGAQTGGLAKIGGLSGLAAGMGLRARGYSLDYAFTPFGELGNVQRVSLGARF